MKKYENPEGEHLEVCEGRSSPSDTLFLATRFWCGDGRACAARVALGVGLNKVNKKWESTQPTAAMASHFWLEKSYVLNFFLSTFSLVWYGIAEEMRRAGGVSLRGFVEVLGRRDFVLEKKLSLFERSEFDNFFSGFSKISTP